MRIENTFVESPVPQFTEVIRDRNGSRPIIAFAKTVATFKEGGGVTDGAPIRSSDICHSDGPKGNPNLVQQF